MTDTGSVSPTLPPELYVLLFQQAADAMFVTDPRGRLVEVNQRASALLGFAAAEMIGRPLAELVDSDEPVAVPVAGQAAVMERRLLCKDGRRIPVELTTRLLPGGQLVGVARELTERRRSEEVLRIARARLDALWSVSSLSDADVKTVCNHILVSIVRMTGSEYGFYGFINADESVMTIHSWSGDAMRDCSLVDKPQEFVIREAGVWGEAVRRRSPLILNDYAGAHAGKKGLPPGHVPLTRLLVVPFFSRGRITAVAAVANRPANYSQEDVVQMTSFLNSIEAATVRGRAEEALRLRNS